MADRSKVAEADLCYLAGLVDGEGCFVINRKQHGKGKVYYSAKLVIAMSGPVIPTFQKRLGIGTVSFRKPQKKRWRGVWVWTICKNDLWPILPRLIPKLIGKTSQAVAVYEVFESQGFHVGRGRGAEQCAAAYVVLREANTKGAM